MSQETDPNALKIAMANLLDCHSGFIYSQMEVLSILKLALVFLLVFVIDAQIFVASTGYCSANIRFQVRLTR